MENLLSKSSSGSAQLYLLESSVEATQPNPRIQAWSVLLLSRERDQDTKSIRLA